MVEAFPARRINCLWLPLRSQKYTIVADGEMTAADARPTIRHLISIAWDVERDAGGEGPMGLAHENCQHWPGGRPLLSSLFAHARARPCSRTMDHDTDTRETRDSITAARARPRQDMGPTFCKNCCDRMKMAISRDTEPRRLSLLQVWHDCRGIERRKHPAWAIRLSGKHMSGRPRLATLQVSAG